MPESTVKPKARWLQFSLRSLLLLMLCAACYVAGWTHHAWRTRIAAEEKELPPTSISIPYDQPVFAPQPMHPKPPPVQVLPPYRPPNRVQELDPTRAGAFPPVIR